MYVVRVQYTLCVRVRAQYSVMDYLVTTMSILQHHASRTVLLVEVPPSGWLRGEHVLGHLVDGTPRCVVLVSVS